VKAWWILAGAIALQGCMPSCESDKERKVRHNQSIVWVKLFDELLRGLHRGTPAPGTVGEKDCKDEEIGPKVKPLLTPELCTVDWEFLDRYASPKPDQRGEADPWGFLRVLNLRDPIPPAWIGSPADAEAQANGYQYVKQHCPYIGVFRAKERRLPEMGKADEFERGVWDGWLTVVDQATMQPVCQAHFRAESSATPPHKDHLVVGRAAREADLTDDFKDQVERGAKQALGRITRALQIEFSIL
jgi:hypothetical protein